MPQSQKIRRKMIILSRTRRALVALLMMSFGFDAAYKTQNHSTSDTVSNLIFWGLIATSLLAVVNWLLKPRLLKNIYDEASAEFGLIDIDNETWQTPPHITSPLMSYGILSSSSAYIYKVGQTDWTLATVTNEMQGLPLINVSTSNFSVEYMVLSIPLSTHLPHIFIDGTKQNSFSKSQDMWSLNRKLSRKNRLQDLEGDFYKYFNVYTTNKEYLTALSILTPDVMLRLRDKGYEFDYEIYDDHLYVIRDARLTSTEDLRSFLTAAQSCLDELLPQITKHIYRQPGVRLPMHKTGVGLLALGYAVRILLKKFLVLCLYVFAGIVLAGIFFIH